MTHKLILMAAAGAATLCTVAPAFAQDGAFEPTTRIVRYDDLNLSNERGRERLDTRVRSAVNSACGYWSARALSEKRIVNKCREQAMAKAQIRVAEVVRNASSRYARRSDN